MVTYNYRRQSQRSPYSTRKWAKITIPWGISLEDSGALDRTGENRVPIPPYNDSHLLRTTPGPVLAPLL